MLSYDNICRGQDGIVFVILQSKKGKYILSIATLIASPSTVAAAAGASVLQYITNNLPDLIREHGHHLIIHIIKHFKDEENKH